MPIEARYHPKFFDDVTSMSDEDQDRVETVINYKLKSKPFLYGKPLRYDLKSYRSIRIGKYRLGFKIKKDIVYILGIVHRSKAYKEFLKRIKNRS